MAQPAAAAAKLLAAHPHHLRAVRLHRRSAATIDDSDLRSRLAGLDFRLTYRPPEAGTRRDITFRAEGYRLHATELGTTTNRYGAFLDLHARLSRRWVLGARYDYVEAPRGPDDTEWRITPSLTWWQSEFVYLRLEGEHRDSDLEVPRTC